MIFFSCPRAFAQQLMYGIGGAYSIDRNTEPKNDVSSGMMYSLALIIPTASHLSLSAEIPLMYGKSGHPGKRPATRYRPAEIDTPAIKIRTTIDCPLIFNFNVGAFSSKIENSRLGFFAGGGFGYHYGPINLRSVHAGSPPHTDSTSEGYFGPIADIGARVRTGNIAFSLRGTYMKSVGKKEWDTYTISLVANFYCHRKWASIQDKLVK